MVRGVIVVVVVVIRRGWDRMGAVVAAGVGGELGSGLGIVFGVRGGFWLILVYKGTNSLRGCMDGWMVGREEEEGRVDGSYRTLWYNCTLDNPRRATVFKTIFPSFVNC